VHHEVMIMWYTASHSYIFSAMSLSALLTDIIPSDHGCKIHLLVAIPITPMYATSRDCSQRKGKAENLAPAASSKTALTCASIHVFNQTCNQTCEADNPFSFHPCIFRSWSFSSRPFIISLQMVQVRQSLHVFPFRFSTRRAKLKTLCLFTLASSVHSLSWDVHS